LDNTPGVPGGRTPGPSRRATRPLRRLVDVVVSALALGLSAPVLLVAAIAIRLTMGSPVLFHQVRAGLGGRPFDLVKLRTMRRPADAAEGDPVHDGERLTRLGRLLRDTSIDELPTLLCVLRGEMALVGPRPLPVRYLPRYSPRQARRHEVRPGITGWAQVHGRNRLSWDERLELDVWYVDHRSARLDLEILGLTVSQVLRREGTAPEDAPTMPEFVGAEQGQQP
jgi:lipopolysaccharide/colanic/teichoic acid biosynthesis glycosyltransferase